MDRNFFSSGNMSDQRFRVIEINDPLRLLEILPILKEAQERKSLFVDIDAESYVRGLLFGMFSNYPMKIYGIEDVEKKKIACVCIIVIGGITPIVWIEFFGQLKEYAKFNLSELLLEEVYRQLKLLGINEVFMIVTRKGLARRLSSKGKAKPVALLMKGLTNKEEDHGRK